MIWEEWQPAADKEYKAKLRRWQQKKNRNASDAGDKPKCRMHPNDADNFLSFSAAMKIILARSIDISELPRAKELLQQYLHGYHEVWYTFCLTCGS